VASSKQFSRVKSQLQLPLPLKDDGLKVVKPCACTVSVFPDNTTQVVITSPGVTIGLTVAVTLQKLDVGTGTVVDPEPEENDDIIHVNSQGTPEETTGGPEEKAHALCFSAAMVPLINTFPG